MPVFQPEGKWDRMATFTVKSPIWLVRRDHDILLDDDVASHGLGHVEIQSVNIRGYDRVFIVDRSSKHGTWVDNRRLGANKRKELKRGRILTFGPEGMSPSAWVSWTPLMLKKMHQRYQVSSARLRI
jgi:FHA domain